MPHINDILHGTFENRITILRKTRKRQYSILFTWSVTTRKGKYRADYCRDVFHTIYRTQCLWVIVIPSVERGIFVCIWRCRIQITIVLNKNAHLPCSLMAGLQSNYDDTEEHKKPVLSWCTQSKISSSIY
jgi:hypothetical protein